jgi:ABC-type cobalamin transport system ATPase subunit
MQLNDLIQETLTSLQQQHRALLAKVGETTEEEIARALLREAQEVLFRINVTQNLALESCAKDLSEQVSRVKRADQRLTDDLQLVTNAATVIRSVTGYLTEIDETIDFLKVAVFT